MADNSLDAKTRAVEKMRVDKGNQFEAYQAAENQLLAIRSEQKQNLAMARAQSAATTQENNLIGQVAGLVDDGGAGVVQTPINAATQGVLGKYGMGPTVSKTTQRQTQSVTKQNVTINNYTTTNNTTNNNVNGGGPMQGRPLVVNRDNNSAGRFKVWVQNVIAKQNEQAAIRDKEYERRESALTRSANRMTRKLEGISSNISKSLDPRRLNATLKDSISTILKMVGFGLIVSNFPKIVDSAISLEKKVTNFLDYMGITGRSARAEKGEDSRLVKDLKYFLGGNAESGKNVTLLSTIGQLFMGDGKKDGIIGLIRKEFELLLEHRGKAIERIPGPDISLWSTIKDPGASMAKMVEYLKNVLQVALAGDGSIQKAASIAAEKESKQAMMDNGVGDEYFNKSAGWKQTEEGRKHVSFGDTLRFGKKGATHLFSHDVDEEGNLTSLGAALTQSRYISSNLTAKDGNINFRGILEGISRLEKSAGDGATVVDKSFLDALESIGVDVAKLREHEEKFKVVPVKKGELEKLAEKNANASRDDKMRRYSGMAGMVGANALLYTSVAASGGLSAPAAFAATAGASALGYNAGKKLGNALAQLGYEDYGFMLVPESDPNFKNKKGEHLSGLTDANGVLKLPVLTKGDFENIYSQLGSLTGQESFSVDDLASTNAFADYLMKRMPSRTISENDRLALQGSKEDEEYRKRREEIFNNSIPALAYNRAVSSVGRTLERIEDKITVDPSYGIFYRKKNNPNIQFNIDKAVKWLEEHDKKASTGKCARHVALGIEAGFGKVFSDKTAIGSLGWAGAAKNEGEYLKYLGFVPINSDTAPQRGDIRILQPKNPENYGHIEMYTGSDWFSDFKQKDSLYKSGHYRDYQTYRYAGNIAQGIDDSVEGDIVPESAYSSIEPVSSASVIESNANNAGSFTTSWGTIEDPEGSQSYSYLTLPKSNLTSPGSSSSISTPARIDAAMLSSATPESVLSTVSVANKVNELTNATISGNQSLNDSLNTLIQISNLMASSIAANVDSTNTVAQAVSNLVPLIQSANTPPKAAVAASKTT